MMGAALFAIAFLHWIALVTPGPNTLIITSLAAGDSRRSAMCAAAGITVVAGLWSSLAVLGIHALFTAHHNLRLAVQIAGGCYLIYLGLRLWRTGTASTEDSPARLSPFAAFRVGFLTNFTNPKSVLFFSSVFATGLPADPPALLMALAVAVAVINAFLWHMLLAIAFSHRRAQVAYGRSRSTIGRAAGILLGIFGVRLLATVAGELRNSTLASR
jgi:threonine efflux protein